MPARIGLALVIKGAEPFVETQVPGKTTANRKLTFLHAAHRGGLQINSGSHPGSVAPGVKVRFDESSGFVENDFGRSDVNAGSSIVHQADGTATG